MRVAGVFLVAADGAHRHFVHVGVEVAANRDERVWVSIEQLVYQQPDLQSLAGPLQRGEKEAFRPAGHAAPDLRFLVPGDERGTRRAQVNVNDVQRWIAVQSQLRMQNRSIPFDRLRISRHRAIRRDLPVQWREDQIVQDLPLTEKRKAAQDHQVVLVAIAALAAADGAHAMKALIGRIGEQGIERRKSSLAAATGPLAIHLLQAEHVGAKS